MTKNTNENIDNIEEKLNYIGLDFENIPEFFDENEPIEARTIYENEFKKFKVYKFVDVSDIQILITPKNRMDSLTEKYKLAKKISHYLKPKDEDDILLQTTFLKMIKEVNIEEIKKIEELQKNISKKIPFKVGYDENYLWEVYYSEAYNKYFMLFPSEDKNYASLFYLVKKQIESYKKGRSNKIFIPICYMEYTGEYLKKSELNDIENCIWLFTKDWPSVYEVFDKQGNMTIQIVGNTYIYEDLKSYYKITLKTKEDSIKFYKFIKALFILQSEIPHKYKFIPKINRYGSLMLYYDNKKIEYEELPQFIENEYKELSEELQNIVKEKFEKEKSIEGKRKISKDKEKEYFQKEKEITLYLECKKTFFGKIKYFFKHKKILKNIKKEEIEEENSQIEQEKIELKEKQFYNIEDLIRIYNKYEKIENEVKNLNLDIEALNEKIKMMERKIKNATLYIEEIDKHNKSIFEFWKFTNKDEKVALNAATQIFDEKSNVKLQKTFNFESDFEEFATKIDNKQRKKLTKEECEAIFLTQTNMLELLNILKPYVNKNKKISKKNEAIIKLKLEMIQEEAGKNKDLFDKEEYDIFGRLSENNTKIQYINGKKHRELERNKFKILDINKNTQLEEFIESLEKCIEEIEKSLENNSAIINMPVYRVQEEVINTEEFSLFNLNIQKAVDEKEEDKINLYKINIKENDNIVYLSNIIYFDNSNSTLPLGMDVSDKALVDLGKYELELINKDMIKANQEDGLYNKVKNINIFEYNINKK